MEISKKNPKEIIKGYEGLYQKRIMLDNITKEDIEIGKKRNYFKYTNKFSK